MKTEIVSGEVEPKEIDWSKMQLVKSKHNEAIVLTNGVCRNDMFYGILINQDTTDSSFLEIWAVDAFELVTESLTIKFIP